MVLQKIHSMRFIQFRKLSDNGSRLGEVAEHKTSLELQMFKLR